MASSDGTKFKVIFTTILALVLLIGGIFWVKKYNPMARKQTVTVVFDNANGLSPGDPVSISGINTGEITNVFLSAENSAFVEFSLKENINLHPDSDFKIVDVGLMGDKALIIDPGSKDGSLDTDVVHNGSAGTGLNDLFTKADDLMKKLNSITTKIDNDLDLGKLSATLEETAQSLTQAIAMFENIARDNREPIKNSISSFDGSISEFRDFIKQNDTRLGEAFDSFERTSGNLTSALENIDNISTVIDTLAVYMKSGDGTMAKLVKTDQLYEELRRTNADIDSFITDFRLNPGKYTKDMNFKIRLF